MNQDKIGKFISERRKAKSLTQQELAKKLNVTDKAISKWENGRCLPDTLLLKPLCQELNITINELLSGEIIEKTEFIEKAEENIVNAMNFNNKIKKSKRKLSIALITLYSIVCFFGYKLINYNYYKIIKMSSFDISISETFDKTLMTKSNNEKYISLKNLSIRNDFQDFYKFKYQGTTSDNINYVLFDKLDKDEAILKISYDDSYLVKFISNLEFDKFGLKQSKLLNEKFFKKRNITNDIELIKYLVENANKKNNIFTSVKKMKENYIINYLCSNIFCTDINNIRILNENTYIINRNNIEEVNIIDNDRLYSLKFINKHYFNSQYVEDLISTTNIKN